MDVTGIKRAWDWDFEMPETVAESIGSLIEAMRNDDANLDCYFEQSRADFRDLPEEQDDILREYYYSGGWMRDVRRTD